MEYKRKGMRGYIDVKVKGEEDKQTDEEQQGDSVPLEEETPDFSMEGQEPEEQSTRPTPPKTVQAPTPGETES
jgi:hypothetical protein